MATAQTQPLPTRSAAPSQSPSSLTTPAPPSNNPSTTTKFTPAQTEARTILDNLLTELQTSKYASKYSPWIQHNGQPQLLDFCTTLVRPQTWTFLSHRWSLDALKPLSGDLRYEGRAIYVNGILGLDKRLRIYVGQSTNLRQRVAQHLNFRYRRDHPCLHYFALQESVYNVLGAVVVVPSSGSASGEVPGMDDVSLLLNVLEMWMCLVFRSLPEGSLREWLPDGDGPVSRKRKMGKEGVVGGLNVACPLDQGTDMAERSFVDLGSEPDPLVKRYLKEVRRRKREDEEGNEEDELLQRKKAYAEKAKGFAQKDTDVHVPQWVVVGALVVAVGYILLNTRGGQPLRAR